MKNILISLLLISLALHQAKGQDEIPTAAHYEQLIAAMDSIEYYDSRYLQHIQEVKDMDYPPDKELQKCQHLFEVYQKFCYDSASVYLDRALLLAVERGDKTKQQELQMEQARYFTTGGLFVEAQNVINQLDKDRIADPLLTKYYDMKRFFYEESGIRLRSKELSSLFWEKKKENEARLMERLDSASSLACFLREQEARINGDYDKALYYNDLQLRLFRPNTPEYSWATYFRSAIYRASGDSERSKFWLIHSALSDIRCSIKDQASLWRLAVILDQEGEEKLSYLLMRATYNATVQFNSPLRYAQIVSFMTIMEHKYQQKTAQQNDRLRTYLWGISLMAILLLGSVVHIYRQMKRIRAARSQLRTANGELLMLNKELSSTLESLHESHQQLAEMGMVKDVYIGRFISLCSDYIKKMDLFRLTIQKKEKSGQLEEYLSTSRMREMKAQEVAEFMNEFDKAFLHIMPTFVEEFNLLLEPQFRISSTDKFSLTTEQRIFALIRLGITDSSKIAEFLHYSAQTIYNYRSNIKKKALCSRDEFEKQVATIGTRKSTSRL